MTRLSGKNALITGAARGIGLAFAKAYVAEGARVAIADINIERARDAAAEIGEAAIAVEMDVTDQDSIERAVGATIEQLGQIGLGLGLRLNQLLLFLAELFAGQVAVLILGLQVDQIAVHRLDGLGHFRGIAPFRFGVRFGQRRSLGGVRPATRQGVWIRLWWQEKGQRLW